MSSDVRTALGSALVAFAALVDTPVVGAAWDHASALEGYTVGGLVGHVVSGTSSVFRYLAVDLLIAAGRRSRGDLAVLRALTRGERDTVAALRVL
jgi:hypothetical protein